MHTIGPWFVKQLGKQLYIEAERSMAGGFIADMQLSECTSDDERAEARANAELIVKAVNKYLGV